MKTLQRALALLLSLLLLCLPVGAQITVSQELSANGTLVTNYEVEDLNDLAALLAERTELRDDSNFTITCPDGIEKLVGDGRVYELLPIVRRMMAELGDESGSGADYNAMNLQFIESGVLENRLYLHPIYLTSQEEEDRLDQVCDQIIRELELDGLTPLERVRRIYEYVGTNFTFDNTQTIYSAYEGVQKGTMVCQGYSILMHKLLARAGIPSRILTGWSSGGESHSWIAAKLNRSWFYLDVTWDACTKKGEAMSWNYFLRGEKFFSDHIPDEAHSTSVFRQKCPISELDYPLNRTVLKAGDEKVSALAVRKGLEIPLSAYVNGSFDPVTVLETTDPSVASVSQDGRLTALKAGTCTIVARTDNQKVLPAMVPLVVFDLEGLSSWASEAVEECCRRKLLPLELASDLQKPLTRAEAARALYPLFEQKGLIDSSRSRGFSDTVGHPDELFIARLSGLGVFEGTGMDTFSPDAPIYREQAAKILACAAALLGGEPLTAGYYPAVTDREDICLWARPYVTAVMRLGIMKGLPDGSFDPHGLISREQLFCTILRMADRY